ncbi:phosphate acyltransferase PlsX [Waterburya agarophytonicola K14]|uniref:Phosphate acyltransferase n=1 Tax=Waterburya agarophytonicola KI4 TaxID=2874699 RepID=A0A964FE57_9CYAN|nr:phosphate acyltransferase PlsX [Waterburya agarophytonicola]MCC0175781.1 phosphate acyltransferase PlsX [Waterburya agarophytonicola KI4]
MGLTRARIAVDAMGGDFAPEEIVAGAIKASAELDLDVLLVGDKQQIDSLVEKYNSKETASVEVIHAEDVITMKEEPLTGIRRKPKASINVAMDLVKGKKADAVVSAGHSGAAMASALLRLGRLKGIERPAIGAVLPTIIPNKSVIVLDVGANVDCKPKYLEQFALMGTIYSKYVLGNEEPQVGLLNIGEESSKGNELALATHKLLADNSQIPFLGNAEGRDVLSGEFDVIVCDGFVGNIVLKFAEAIGEVMLQIMKEELPKGWRGKVGTVLLKPNLRDIKRRIDRAEHGGALLFGVAGICIISHGSSRQGSMFNAIRSAKEAIDNDVLEKIKSYNNQRLESENNHTEAASASSK